MNEHDGVTQFRAQHTVAELSGRSHVENTRPLVAWRTILSELGLIGQDPKRYGGAGFGNISVRCGPFPGARSARPFLISGTQTGGQGCVSAESFALVERYDLQANRVTSRGVIAPSSESMTHGAIYNLGGHIRAVVHVHAPILWAHARPLGLPTTGPDIGYGTTEMAHEIGRLSRESTLWERQVLAMAGHEDGVISFGRTVEAACVALLAELAQAYALDFEATGQGCSSRA